MNYDIKYTIINSYLGACSDICSIIDAPVSSHFYFHFIGNSNDMLPDFKNYFINIWEQEGYPGYYKSYDTLIKEFSLRFEKENNWRYELNKTLEFWLKLFIYKDISYIKNKVIEFIDDILIDKNFEVYVFGKEDFDFLRHNLDYLKNDDFIFKTDKGTYLLHFGMSD